MLNRKGKMEGEALERLEKALQKSLDVVQRVEDYQNLYEALKDVVFEITDCTRWLQEIEAKKNESKGV